MAAAPPADDDSSSPFQTKVHTPHAILCGDFNLEASEPEYAPSRPPAGATPGAAARRTAAPVRPSGSFDRTYGPTPIACDFVFVSDSLVPRVQSMWVDGQTRASDHQPVALQLG